ncbi:thioredoxin [Trichococcus palustris]|jgi:putative protein-disulfide isomerase|uniref:Thioredoxin n=1 Tax=Trichococcus palustris TaxID=140314 RepID=A0A143YLQ7_9LACT|nr:DsbA family protein [Trichococcus palustris]CZQ93034.1 thioredoxin [Trichococcus palustris]SFK85123.1 Predicted dithiol-disulfide isomerase, DsbA family [Trichococcus palustris]
MTENTVAATQVDLYYATDPLCSFCWAFEPTLRKFRYQYGKYLAQDTIVMGGMIEKWATFGGDAGNGITRASDVAHHWQEIGRHTRMPIDGSIWSDTPIDSSFPSSQVFEIVRRDYPESANLILRKLREAVMLWNQNIAEEAVLRDILDEMDLDSQKIWDAADSLEGRALLNGDLQLTRALQATGFPTIVFVNAQNQGIKVVGAQPFEALVDALVRILPEGTNVTPDEVPPLATVMKEQPLLLSKEIEVLYGLTEKEVFAFVEQALGAGNFQAGTVLNERYYKWVD